MVTEINFTYNDMMGMKPGTLVKIKKSVKCAKVFKKGGELVFQGISARDDDEFRFGIKTKIATSYSFNSNEYELIDEAYTFDEDEINELKRELNEELNPSIKNGKKRQSARRLISWFCEDNHIKFTVIKEYQIRVFSENLKIDIYPQSKKYHEVTNNKRGFL